MRKILAVLLMVVLLFGCTSAFADTDFETLTVNSHSDAQECCDAFSEYGYEAEMYLAAFGGALIENDAILSYDIWLIGLDDFALKKYDVVYTWEEEYSKFVVATDNVIMLYPRCYDKDDYSAYVHLLGLVLDEVKVSYGEMSTDA